MRNKINVKSTSTAMQWLERRINCEKKSKNRKISAYTLVALFKSGVRNSPKSYQGSNGTDGHFPIP